MRHALHILDDGSIVCQGDILEGTEVHLMISNKEFCQQATKEAVDEAKNALGGRQPKLIIVFESLWRQQLLGRSIIQEIQTMRDVLGPTVPVIGMYSFWEVAPMKPLNVTGEVHFNSGAVIVLAIA